MMITFLQTYMDFVDEILPLAMLFFIPSVLAVMYLEWSLIRDMKHTRADIWVDIGSPDPFKLLKTKEEREELDQFFKLGHPNLPEGMDRTRRFTQSLANWSGLLFFAIIVPRIILAFLMP